MSRDRGRGLLRTDSASRLAHGGACLHWRMPVEQRGGLPVEGGRAPSKAIMRAATWDRRPGRGGEGRSQPSVALAGGRQAFLALRWRRRLVLSAVAASVTAQALAPAPASAALGVGGAEVLATAPEGLRLPPDGRVNGDGFAAEVVGYRFTLQFGAGKTARWAAPGQVFLVFGLTCTTTSVAARLVVGGHANALLGETGYSGLVPTYYLASVPEKAADVALELSKGGFSQEFSFTKGEREGPSQRRCMTASTAGS